MVREETKWLSRIRKTKRCHNGGTYDTCEYYYAGACLKPKKREPCPKITYNFINQSKPNNNDTE